MLKSVKFNYKFTVKFIYMFTDKFGMFKIPVIVPA